MKENMIGKFVSVKLKGTKKDVRQGWIISLKPFQIIGQSGTVYKGEGEPVVISNPPKRG